MVVRLLWKHQRMLEAAQPRAALVLLVALLAEPAAASTCRGLASCRSVCAAGEQGAEAGYRPHLRPGGGRHQVGAQATRILSAASDSLASPDGDFLHPCPPASPCPAAAAPSVQHPRCPTQPPPSMLAASLWATSLASTCRGRCRCASATCGSRPRGMRSCGSTACRWGGTAGRYSGPAGPAGAPDKRGRPTSACRSLRQVGGSHTRTAPACGWPAALAQALESFVLRSPQDARAQLGDILPVCLEFLR